MSEAEASADKGAEKAEKNGSASDEGRDKAADAKSDKPAGKPSEAKVKAKSEAPKTEPGTNPSVRPSMAPPPLTEGGLREFVGELRLLRESQLFWVGVVLKLACALLFGSHFATRWFSPFVYEFVHGHFANPWETFLARGEPMAFPYGPGMLFLLSIPYLPAAVVSFDPSGHVGLLLLRLPLFAADLVVCVLLMRWARMHAKDVVVAYWLSPIVLYSTYIHGQLDLLPTALLCVALFLMFTRRRVAAAIVFGLALATKGHLVIALPFAMVYLLRQRQPLAWFKFAITAAITAAAFYALPLGSPAFRQMVLGSVEAKKMWAVAIPYGLPGLSLYLAPAAVAVAFLRFFSYRKVNRELTMMFIGALYVGLVAIVPPQPGWFIWSIPFVGYLWARFSRIGRYAILFMSSAYLLYFFVADPTVFLEALDPVLGAGAGARGAAYLTATAPNVFSAHGASIAWTGLFSATALTGFEMYRRGVRSNAIYNFRDETFMIGVGGDSGAGKHTIAGDMRAIMGSQLLLINGDDDHRWERGHAMWRRYTHLDPRGNFLAEQLEGLAALRRGHEVRKRHYDHDVGRFTDPILLRPTDFVAIVGLHPFYLASQRQILHLRIFVDTDEQLRRKWKVTRDVAKRGYSPEKVLTEIERRMADSIKYVHPQKRYADVVIRHKDAANASETVDLEIEIGNSLHPLDLVDLLSQASSLEVEWHPDEALTRDTISVKGDIGVEELRVLASAATASVEDLLDDSGEAWKPGGRGLVQLVLLHAITARLRTELSTAASGAVATGASP